MRALPPGVKQIFGRADSGFYCREAVEAYEECNARFVISARKTSRLVEQLRQAEWKPSRSWERRFDRMEEVVSSNLTRSTKSLSRFLSAGPNREFRGSGRRRRWNKSVLGFLLRYCNSVGASE